MHAIDASEICSTELCRDSSIMVTGFQLSLWLSLPQSLLIDPTHFFCPENTLQLIVPIWCCQMCNSVCVVVEVRQNDFCMLTVPLSLGYLV